MYTRSRKQHLGSKRSHRAQALVEFALALPILLLVVYGLLEAGRVIFTIAAVANAAREAARYASATGVKSSGSTVLHYQDCTGIRTAAKRTGFLLNLQDSQILIYWDGPDRTAASGGPVTTPQAYCAPGTTSATGVVLRPMDRVLVKVTTQYTLLLPLVPLTSRTISSGNTARTVMGVIDLNVPVSP